MERNKYELQREVLARKYETILKDFEDTNDDRRIAWNCYQQIIAACEAMRDSGMENNFTCGYVDCVIGMMTSKEAARKLLREQLYDMRNELTKEHYLSMYEYIDKATGQGGGDGTEDDYSS